MKNLLSIVLSILLTLVCTVSAMAEDFDMSVFLDEDNGFHITESQDQEIAYIDSGEQFTTEEKSFVHAYEHETLYSYITTEVVIQDYFGDEPCPAMRTWINFRTNEKINIDSVTFTFNNRDYTFSALANAGNIEEKEGGFVEDMLIVFGEANEEFLLDIYDYLNASENLEDLEPISFVLHGDKDVESEWGLLSMWEFGGMLSAYLISNGIDSIDRIGNATPLEITEVI